MQAPAAAPPACPPQWQRVGRGRAAPHTAPCAPKGGGCLLQLGVRGHRATPRQSRALRRGAAERANRRASEPGRAEGQRHRGCKGTGTQRARQSRCDPIWSHIQSYCAGNSGKEFCAEQGSSPRPWRTSPRDAEGRDGAAGQTRRVSQATSHQVCVVAVGEADTTTLLLSCAQRWGARMGAGSITNHLMGNQAGGAPFSRQAMKHQIFPFPCPHYIPTDTHSFQPTRSFKINFTQAIS